MAIKMDGHEITALELHGANGQTVTKQLTEELNLQTKTATQNGEVTADNGYDGLAKVNVNVEGGGDVVVEQLNVTNNGTYTAPSGKAYSPVIVNVQGGGGSYPSFADIYTVLEDIVDDGDKGGAAKLVDLIVAAYPNFYSVVLLDEPTVDNQIVGMMWNNASYTAAQQGGNVFLRYRNGVINKKTMTTSASGAAKAGTRYLIMSHETVN